MGEKVELVQNIIARYNDTIELISVFIIEVVVVKQECNAPSGLHVNIAGALEEGRLRTHSHHLLVEKVLLTISIIMVRFFDVSFGGTQFPWALEKIQGDFIVVDIPFFLILVVLVEMSLQSGRLFRDRPLRFHPSVYCTGIPGDVVSYKTILIVGKIFIRVKPASPFRGVACGSFRLGAVDLIVYFPLLLLTIVTQVARFNPYFE